MAALHGDRGPLQPADNSNIQITRSLTGTVKTHVGNSLFHSKFGITLHNTSLEDSMYEPATLGHRKSHSASSISPKATIIMKKITSLDDCGIKFPKLEECAHFHYDVVEIGPLQVSLNSENEENLFFRPPDSPQPQPHFYIHVTSRDKTWTVRRTYDNLRVFDKQLHRCIFDRKFSLLPELRKNELTEEGIPAMKKLLVLYLNRFSAIADNMINCGPVLSWLELDNRGNQLIVSDDSAINTPAVGAAHVTKRYTAQDQDEISFEVGNIVSIIDMPPCEESAWWRGKKGFEVGFFPAACVELINEKLSQAVTSQLPHCKPKPVLRKHGKLISLLRNFFSSRPARTQLKRTGIVKERVFGCDLGEHLLNTSREIPLVLECCANTIETHGIVDGIYRLSGVTSNIQKLRNEFDEEHVPCLTDECYLQDIHSISSLLKAYFRDLPNPLFTFQLYDKFFAAIQADNENKLLHIHDVIQQLPPPHYRTAKYLMEHLMRVSKHGKETGMHCKNLAIVWAPNLLRSKALDRGGCSTAMLQGVGVQAIVTEYLISHADLIFSDQLQHLSASIPGADGSLQRGRPKSLAISSSTRLLSLEEARAMVNTQGSPKQKYIEVGGGPSQLPDKYHTVIEVPNKKKSRKDRKSPSGWRSIFSKKGQITKVKDQERSDNIDFVSSGSSRDVFGDDDEDDGIGGCRLRTVRSADSLLSESRHNESLAAQARSRFSDNVSDSTTFVNYYTDGGQSEKTRTYSLDRMVNNKATKRSISADNSYSESEMEPIIDMSPADDLVMPSGMDSSSPRMDLMSELGFNIQVHPTSVSPKDASRSRITDLGSMPVLMPPHLQEPRVGPKSESDVGSLDNEHGQQPLKPKRSKSTALTQTDAGFRVPVPAPRSHVSSNPRGSDAAEQPTTAKTKTMSPGKRKKAKAPLPPVASPRLPKTRTDYTQSQPTACSYEDLVTVELTESPGARRKLLHSGRTHGPRDLETHGLEGAPGELATYEQNLTDDEAFITQNLSLTTDSEAEVEKRESLSVMEGVQDDTGHVGLNEYESGRDVNSKSKAHDTTPDGINGEHTYMFPTETEQQIIEGDYNTSGSGEPNIPYGFDQSSVMEKSLDSMLRGVAEPYYSSDEVSHPEAPIASFAELLDSNSDGQMSSATMSTNFTTSSELACVSSTSDEDLTSAQVYADNLRHSSSKRPQYIRKSVGDYSTTSESDVAYDRDGSTPVVRSPPVSFPVVYTPSDSDTEIARTPDEYSSAHGLDSGDQMISNIDLSDSEVVFVDPHARLSQEGYDPISDEIISGIEAPLPRPPDEFLGEPGHIVIRTPLDDSLEGQAFHAQVSKVVKPPRLVAHGLMKVDASDLGDISPTGDAAGQVVSADDGPVTATRLPYGDGYLADRSSSTSPTFGETSGKLVKKTTSYRDQDIEIAIGASHLDTVTETSPEEPDTVLIPHTTVEPQTVSNDHNIDYHTMDSHKDLKKSADSLLFEMEDLDSNMRDSGRSSIDRLNMSSENDEVFFRPESLDIRGSETNMSISPDNYLADPGKGMQSVEDIPVASIQTQSQATINQTPEYQVRSAAALDREKKGSELCRKQSVRELLSKFESSTQSSDSSDDTTKGSETERTTSQHSGCEIAPKEAIQRVLLVTDKTICAPQSPKAPSPTAMSVSPQPEISKPKRGSLMRKPSAGISDRIRNFNSGYSSSEESDPTKSSSQNVEHCGRKCETSTDRDKELHSSRGRHDLDHRFESPPRDTLKSFQAPVALPRPSAEMRMKTQINESTSGDQSSTADKQTSEEQEFPHSLADRMRQFQDQTVSTESGTKSDMVPPVVAKLSSEPVELDDSESTSRGSTLSDRLNSLAERFKSYDGPSDDGVEGPQDTPAPTVIRSDEKVSSPVPRPRARTKRQPLGKGQYFSRYGHPDMIEPAQVGASASGSESESSSSALAAATSSEPKSTLSERRRKFESFGAADRTGEASSVEIPKPVLSSSLPRSMNKRQTVQAPGNTGNIVNKPPQFGAKSVILEPRDVNVAASWQQETANQQQEEIKATTLPRGFSTKSQEENPAVIRRKKPATSKADDKHISVKDLSRQFERQVSEKSDMSRTSSTGRCWSTSSDVTNGNTPLEPTQDNQNSLNRNTTAQNWTTIL